MKWIAICELYVVRWGSKVGHQKDTSLKVIELLAQKLVNHSKLIIVNIIRGWGRGAM